MKTYIVADLSQGIESDLKEYRAQSMDNLRRRLIRDYEEQRRLQRVPHYKLMVIHDGNREYWMERSVLGGYRWFTDIRRDRNPPWGHVYQVNKDSGTLVRRS